MQERETGGKATGLLRLATAGANVPGWFLVTASAFAAAIAPRRAWIARAVSALREQDLDTPDGRREFGAVARVLEECVARLDAPDVARALESLGPGPYAVRSSAVGEDSDQHSYAGQFTTVLGARTSDDVRQAIARCWSSLYTSHALQYWLARAAPDTTPCMAVIVQRLVQGESSGVMFTRHPITLRDDESLISACWGLGEGVVSGACDADDYEVDSAGRERRVTIADKSEQIILGADGVTATFAVDPHRRSVRALSPAALGSVWREGQRLARAFGMPLDIEFTLAGGELWVLQARPVTARGPVAGSTGALPATVVGAEAPVVWDNSNIQESYCGVTSPLTFSFALAAYASVYKQTLRVLGVPLRTIASHDAVLEQLLGLVRGRVYYNINNWYRGLLLFPSFGRNKEDMERMMGVEEPVDFVADDRPSLMRRARSLPGLLRTGATLLLRIRSIGRDSNRFLARVDAELSLVDRQSLSRLSLGALLVEGRRVRARLLEEWDTPIVNDFHVMMAAGRLRRLVTRAIGAERAPAVVQELLCGVTGVESAEPVRRLLRMAALARSDSMLASSIGDGEPRVALERARSHSPAFAAQWDDYIARYGDRCMGELKLETITLRDDPSFAVRVLRNYLAAPVPDPDAMVEAEQDRRRAAEREVGRGLGIWRRRRFHAAVVAARDGVRQRERLRLARTRVFGFYRELYLAIGARLAASRALADARDVFYLTTEEIDALHSGTAVTARLADLVAVRRAEFDEYRRTDAPPNRFETTGPPRDAVFGTPAPIASSSRVLQGLGCSPGKATGSLRVVHSATDDLDVHGRVLTAVRTDPGWAPLFPSAIAILVERGSTLSHSAVLARELGIPAVVGVRDLLRLVRDGERVALDGAAGTVERLDFDAQHNSFEAVA